MRCSVKSKAFVVSIVVASLALGCHRSRDAKEHDDLPSGAVPVTSAAPAVPTLSNATPAPLPNASPEVKMGPLSFAPVAKSADRSVVTISTLAEQEERSIFGRGRRVREMPKGLGTGFIVEKDGVIVTNNHVIDGADKIVVQLSDGRRLEDVRVAGRDPRTDIAVLKVQGEKDLPAIALGDSDGLEVGDWVVAIGNPFGLSHTVSAGIVSAKGRSREDVPLDPSGYYNFIQTDASINPGNSGGPLLNLKGEVVGMNSAIRGGGAQGIGFAIPINMVKQILPVLLREGHLTRSAIGIEIADPAQLPPKAKSELKLADGQGAAVVDVDPSGPAGKAGLEPGDLIVAFDNQPIDRSSLLQWLASTAGVGKTVTLRVVRQSKTFDLNVTLGALKESRAPERARQPRPRDPSDGY
jgi:serine protease Do